MVVEPLDPFEGGELDVLQEAPRAPARRGVDGGIDISPFPPRPVARTQGITGTERRKTPGRGPEECAGDVPGADLSDIPYEHNRPVKNDCRDRGSWWGRHGLSQARTDAIKVRTVELPG